MADLVGVGMGYFFVFLWGRLGFFGVKNLKSKGYLMGPMGLVGRIVHDSV